VDLTDPATSAAYESDKATGRASSQALIDTLLNNGTPADAGDDLDVVAVPSGDPLVGIADRAGYPVLTVPAGYGTGGAGGNPIGVTFVGPALGEAKLLAAGYAFEQATNVRLAPSYTNPSMWRCVPGSTFFLPHHCNPGDLQSDSAFGPTEYPVATGVSGTVPATLALTLGPAASFGALTAGVAKDYTAQTSANVISTAGNAALSFSDPGHLTNGSFALPSPLVIELSKSSWTGPVSNDPVTIRFAQRVNANDALRTGTYSKTVTFTLSTTQP
jgi:hypothetical protein